MSIGFQDKIKICVSGAAETGHCGLDAFGKAKALGREIILQNGILVTGATTGFPYWATIGAKEVKGLSIGISPAITEAEHVDVYKLPIDNFDLIIYTGYNYSGRNLLLTRSSDAVLVGCGRIGTINEFTIAFDDKKPVGVLEGTWKTDEIIKLIIENAHLPTTKLVYDSDPKALVERVIELVKKEKKNRTYLYEKQEHDPAEDFLIA